MAHKPKLPRSPKEQIRPLFVVGVQTKGWYMVPIPARAVFESTSVTWEL